MKKNVTLGVKNFPKTEKLKQLSDFEKFVEILKKHIPEYDSGQGERYENEDYKFVVNHLRRLMDVAEVIPIVEILKNKVDALILLTPSGDVRNALCDQNLYTMQLLERLKNRLL